MLPPVYPRTPQQLKQLENFVQKPTQLNANSTVKISYKEKRHLEHKKMIKEKQERGENVQAWVSPICRIKRYRLMQKNKIMQQSLSQNFLTSNSLEPPQKEERSNLVSVSAFQNPVLPQRHGSSLKKPQQIIPQSNKTSDLLVASSQDSEGEDKLPSLKALPEPSRKQVKRVSIVGSASFKSFLPQKARRSKVLQQQLENEEKPKEENEEQKEPELIQIKEEEEGSESPKKPAAVSSFGQYQFKRDSEKSTFFDKRISLNNPSQTGLGDKRGSIIPLDQNRRISRKSIVAANTLNQGQSRLKNRLKSQIQLQIEQQMKEIEKKKQEEAQNKSSDDSSDVEGLSNSS